MMPRVVAPAPAPPAPAPAALQQGPALAPAAVVAAPAPAPAPAAALQMQGPAPAPAPAQGNGNAGPNAPPGVLMRDFPGAPGTRIGLSLRLAQACLAAAAVGAMASTDGYANITGFRYVYVFSYFLRFTFLRSKWGLIVGDCIENYTNYFVPAAALQCMWSLAMAIVDVYALLVGRPLRNPRTVGVLGLGDWITGALTLIAASVSAGITTLINDDLEVCYENPCPSFMAATAMAFLSWFALAPCYVLNLGQLVYKLQRP